MLKAFLDGLTKRLGDLAGGAVIVGGSVLLTWLEAPQTYTFSLVRWQLAAAVGALALLVIVSAAFIYRYSRRSPPFYLSPVGHRGTWGTAKQPDGSLATQINATVIAKNLTSTPLHLVTVRVVSPRIRGDVLVSMVTGEQLTPSRTAGSDAIPPHSTQPVAAMIIVRGTPKQERGRMKAVLAIGDDEGREQFVQLSLNGLA